MNDQTLQYPIGKFSPQEAYSKLELEECIRRIETLPSRVDSMIKNFSGKQLETSYREGGWSARQVLHHISDSHMNAYIRFKWALTEDTPVIKAYNEKLWAETPETKMDPLLSVNLLKALHVKWVALMKSLTTEDLQKEYIHPETQKHIRLDRLVAMYAWHGDHHLAHLEIVAKKN
ncbi:MAG: YfiT family bacillithiol transferase [Cyclobacteriaceae bacterium]